MTVTQVAIGGALGSAARFLTGIGVLRLFGQTPFPLAILLVNVLGSFLMGVFVVLAAKKGLSHLSPFMMTGFLGGFTTFSAFSLETMTLIERGQVTWAMLYALASVGLSVAGLAIGLAGARAVFA